RAVEPLFGDAPARTTFASDDPRAMHLYVGLGMTPLWPNFYLDGRVERIHRPAGLDVTDASPSEVAALETEWTGIDRSADHERWAARPGDRPFVVEAAGEPVGAGPSRPRAGRGGAGRGTPRPAAHT